MGLLELEKRCGKCGAMKPHSAFRLRSDRSQLRHSYCKECERDYQREWRRANPRRQTVYTRNYRFRKQKTDRAAQVMRHGLTLAEYEAMEIKQDGVCAICRRKCPSGRALAVDHDHETGLIRGLLCGSCNRALGLLGDDPDRIELAAAYLRERK